eukprot:scaffold3840_cov129-Cylindrotheca_fusiformis.AAC.7
MDCKLSRLTFGHEKLNISYSYQMASSWHFPSLEYSGFLGRMILFARSSHCFQLDFLPLLAAANSATD